jgi:hypothetical protein
MRQHAAFTQMHAVLAVDVYLGLKCVFVPLGLLQHNAHAFAQKALLHAIRDLVFSPVQLLGVRTLFSSSSSISA